MNRMAIVFIVAGSLTAPLGRTHAADDAKPVAGPSVESAYAAEHQLSQAMLSNDADATGRLLAGDWSGISPYAGASGLADRAGFLAAMKSGNFTRTILDTFDPRVRVYDDVATVTLLVATAGSYNGLGFDVYERQTDVWVWRDGGWKCVQTDETIIKPRV